MKQYWLREIGWQYNDSTYEYDTEYLLADLTDDYESAAQRKKELERAQFILGMPRIFRYETHGDYKNSRLARLKLVDYLVDELRVNPALELIGIEEFKPSFFTDVPTNEEIDKMIEISGFEFYRIVEVEKTNAFEFYKARTEWGHFGNDYLRDYHYGEVLFFNNRKEAFARYFEKGLTHDLVWINKEKKLKGAWEELSQFPAQLRDHVNTTDAIQHENSTLLFEHNIGLEEAFMINSLLKKPLLSYHSFDAGVEQTIPLKNVNLTIRRANNLLEKLKYTIFSHQNSEYWRKSEEYLKQFRYQITGTNLKGAYDLIKKTWGPALGGEHILGDDNSVLLKKGDHYLNLTGLVTAIDYSKSPLEMTCDFSVSWGQKVISGRGIRGIGNGTREAMLKALELWLLDTCENVGKDLFCET